MSVSYTHLDVYKRQTQQRPLQLEITAIETLDMVSYASGAQNSNKSRVTCAAVGGRTRT